jgi:hypothetical protein
VLVSYCFIQSTVWYMNVHIYKYHGLVTLYLCYHYQILERGGPFWLLKLRWMGTQRGQIKGVLSWLVRWATRASTRDFCSALAVQASPVHFQFLSPSPSKLGRDPCWVACLTYCTLHKYMYRIFMSSMNYIDISELQEQINSTQHLRFCTY